MHSPEQMRKKMEARAESMHHMQNSAVDGPHNDMKTNEQMYSMPSGDAARNRAQAMREDESLRKKFYAEG